MRTYLTKTPWIVQKVFSDYTWCYSSEEKTIYLTFDDGPTPEVTDFVLDELKKFKKGLQVCFPLRIFLRLLQLPMMLSHPQHLY